MSDEGEGSNWFKLGIIIVLAGCIVAIGAYDLYKRNPRRAQGKLSGPELVRQLHGDSGLATRDVAERARLRQESAAANAPKGEEQSKSELKKLIETLAP